MNENTLQIVGMIVLVSLSFISALTLKFIKIEEFGSDSIGKQKAISKLTWNHYVFSSLCLVVIVRSFNFISNELFIAFFVAGLSALGIKITNEIIKNK